MEPSKVAAVRLAASKTGLTLTQRLVRFIEFSDWDQRFLRKEKGFNRICAAVIAFSVLYLTPFVLAQLLK